MDSSAQDNPGIRRWARWVIVGNAVFVVSWLLAAAWQGPHYSVMAHSISDMYADGAPGATFLIVSLTVSGAAVLMFARWSLWPALRAAGWPATVGAVLLALSIFGLGDLLTVFERLGCRQADAGCTLSAQTATIGGVLDAVLSLAGALTLVAAGFFVASAMRRLPAWRAWARPTRWGTVIVLVLVVLSVLSGDTVVGGLTERLLAVGGAAGIGALAIGILRHTRTTRLADAVAR